jgi:hypothetical protein
MKMPEFIINIIALFSMLVVFSTIFIIIIMAKLINLASGFILTHLASREFRERRFLWE